MEPTTKSSSVNYGLCIGAILSIWTILNYGIGNLELLVNFWIILLITPVLIILIGVISTLKAKTIQGGNINFKEAFTSYFITVVVGFVLSSLISYLIFNVIDKAAGLELIDIVTEKTVKMMERFGAPSDQIALQVAEIENQDKGLQAQILQVFQGIVMFSVVGLIVALIVKKTESKDA